MALVIETGQNRYGPIQPGFTFSLPDGYQVLTGPNNSGKSSLLQLAFVARFRKGGDSPNEIAILLPDRDYVYPSLEIGGGTLANYNSQMIPNIQAAPFTYDRPNKGPDRSQLTASLLGHTDLIGQVRTVNDYIGALGLPRFLVREGQQIKFADIVVQSEGSGMRSLLTIVSALSDDRLQLICIDEPELSLEPRIQKALRDLLMEKAKDRTILVATHSHLFLNRQKPGANHRVTRGADGIVLVETMSTDEDLFDISFDLLGSDTEDLFFPGNYWAVEGSSDQVICQRALDLLGVRKTKVKVLVAGGITNVAPSLQAVMNSLVPLTMNDSPYAKRVVALIDEPDPSQEAQRAELARVLGDRLFVLPVTSMEAYVSSDLYQRVGRVKENELGQIETIAKTGDYKALGEYKRQLSNALAQQLTNEDLEAMPHLKEAAKKASTF